MGNGEMEMSITKSSLKNFDEKQKCNDTHNAEITAHEILVCNFSPHQAKDS